VAVLGLAGALLLWRRVGGGTVQHVLPPPCDHRTCGPPAPCSMVHVGRC